MSRRQDSIDDDEKEKYVAPSNGNDAEKSRQMRWRHIVLPARRETIHPVEEVAVCVEKEHLTRGSSATAPAGASGTWLNHTNYDRHRMHPAVEPLAAALC